MGDTVHNIFSLQKTMYTETDSGIAFGEFVIIQGSKHWLQRLQAGKYRCDSTDGTCIVEHCDVSGVYWIFNVQNKKWRLCSYCSIQSQGAHWSNATISALPEERCSQLRLNRFFLIFLLLKIMSYSGFLHILIITFLYCCIFYLELSTLF